MADNTIIQQGKFTSDGLEKTLVLRSDVDWIRIFNKTECAATNINAGFEYNWQRGFGTFSIMKYHPAADHTVGVNTVENSFALVDTSEFELSAINATVTAITNAAIPIVTAGSTAGLSTGSIVRMGSVATAHQLGGMDFSIDTVVDDTSFRLPYMSQLAVAGVAGSFRIINVDRQFYPKWRYVTGITAAASAVITLSVTHGYAVGQKVKVMVPTQANAGVSIWGMTEINNMVGTITAIAANTITLDINSTGFTAFSFASNADSVATALRRPVVVPVGGAVTDTYGPLMDDAVYDGSYIGMKLTAGATAPAGSDGDAVYWLAGKSFSNLIE